MKILKIKKKKRRNKTFINLFALSAVGWSSLAGIFPPPGIR